MPIIAKRQLGQNFLADKNIIRKIIQACELKPSDEVLEIGPGLGAITSEIIPRVKHLVAIETDKRLFEELKKRFPHSHVQLILADFLKFDMNTLPKNLKVIGNLPYYICSPIIAKILQSNERCSELYITVQLEFGRRMVAGPNTKDYSAFSLFVQFYADCKMLFKIKGSSFNPKPRVDSCFLKLMLRKKPLEAPTDEKLFWKIIHEAFCQRRKNILNAVSKTIKKEDLGFILQAHHINPQWRAENLTLSDFVHMANAIHAKMKS